MLGAHMDEIGFIVKSIDNNGFIGFSKVGAAPDKVLEGRKVWLKDKTIPGVIGIKPGHLSSPEESTRAKTAKECYIDIGLSTAEAVKALGIKIGDPIAFQGEYMEMVDKDIICSKSVDDRINCAILVELFEELKDKTFGGTLYGVFSVQEEIGMRGAFSAGTQIEPDYAICIDTMPAGDTPDINTVKDMPIYLGKGPSCPVAEGNLARLMCSMTHRKVLEIIEKNSEKAGVNVQYISLIGESYSTEKLWLTMSGKGVPAASLTVPRRYSHSPVEVFNINDAVDSLRLLESIVLTNAEANLNFID